MASRTRLVLIAVLGCLLGPAFGASSAAAADRYASPGGTGTTCTQLSPCSLQTAVTGATANVDDVIVLPSSTAYTLADGEFLSVPAGVEVRGQDGQPRPTIVGNFAFAPLGAGGSGVSFRHIRVQNSGGPALGFSQGLVVRDAIAVNPSGGTACSWTGAGTLTDSVCWAFGPASNNGTGAGSNVSGGTITATLRNVTAVGGFRGMWFNVNNSNTASTVDAKNVIAYAAAPGETDVQANASGGTTSLAVTMAYSNYDTRIQVGTGTVTDPATNNNQTAQPVFVNEAAGDFHQASGSPTINAGTADAANGPVDIDGDPRNHGTAPDIGADEFDAFPVAVADSATVGEDSSPTGIDVLANDTDTDGGDKQVTSTTDPGNGTAQVTGGGSGVQYQPDPNYCGSDSFTYTLNGGSTATVSITVTCVDDAPTAVADAVTVAQDAAATAIPVLANDTDVDGGTKTVASRTDPAHGTAAITGGGSGVTYQPAAGYCGSDSFTYALNGGSSATVLITVTCAPDTLAPRTSLRGKPPKVTRKRKAKFRFASNEAGSTFLCRLDRKRFRACGSPITFTVRPGRHVLRVKAVDPAGNADATPVVYRWKVLPPPA